ncbi:hypothetical protein [Streptomyces sp. B1I3]|uniref:hypothetical protein n=1 Tax=Streptomyces sp. B1I3 TaxID=3042264 RepID=UPI002781801B|nr:hypothetical protein [Streptomyces sp. B1I3]MDQ0794688.1 hypothetical protein [Streptomyces sp. B1I3]
MMRRRIRFAAVLVVVVLALTGFSTSSHGGKSGKSGKSRSGKSSGSGGGCSNSKKSNGSYHDYDDDDDYGDGSSGSSSGTTYASQTPVSTASEAPALRVIRCARPKSGKRRALTTSSIEIRSTAAGTHLYDVDVTFLDAKGLTVDTGEADVEVGAGEAEIITVAMDSPRLVSRVKRCQVTAELRY